MAQLAGSAHWAEPSPRFAHRARPTPLKCKNEYPVLPLGEETAVQAVVGSIVWAFRRLKKPRCREMMSPTFLPLSILKRVLLSGNNVPNSWGFWKFFYTNVNVFWLNMTRKGLVCYPSFQFQVQRRRTQLGKSVSWAKGNDTRQMHVSTFTIFSLWPCWRCEREMQSRLLEI